jgi:hypothetical protein
MKPRSCITAASQRPVDPAFAYFVRFYEQGKRGVRVLWTDSSEYALGFAAQNRCYGKAATVQERGVWASARAIGFTEASSHVTTGESQ